MNKLLIATLFLFMIAYANTSWAQRPARQQHHAHHGGVHKGHTHPHGHKHKKARKRVKRTRVVHYHYRHLPRRGVTVTSVHKSAVIIKHGGIGYRYHQGIWYKPYGSQWVVARAPHGVRVKVLPGTHRKFVIGPNHYYYYYGTYYLKQNNIYTVVEAPIGAAIGSLPEGAKTITVNGNVYYELDGVYYMPSKDDKGEEVLVVVENPN